MTTHIPLIAADYIDYVSTHADLLNGYLIGHQTLELLLSQSYSAYDLMCDLHCVLLPHGKGAILKNGVIKVITLRTPSYEVQ